MYPSHEADLDLMSIYLVKAINRLDSNSTLLPMYAAAVLRSADWSFLMCFIAHCMTVATEIPPIKTTSNFKGTSTMN